MATVLIADSKPLFAEALSVALEDHPDLHPLKERPITGPACLQAALNLKPDLCVVDYWLTGLGGPGIASQVTKANLKTKVVVLAWLTGGVEFLNALAAGASGFFPKDRKVNELVPGLKKAMESGEPVYPPELEHMRDQAKLADAQEAWKSLRTLGPREIQVLGQLALQGIEETAHALSISPATVRTHVTNVCRKLEVTTLMQAISIARRYELIPP